MLFSLSWARGNHRVAAGKRGESGLRRVLRKGMAGRSFLPPAGIFRRRGWGRTGGTLPAAGPFGQGSAVALSLGQQGVQGQRTGCHGKASISVGGPVSLGAIAVKFDAVAVGVGQVDRLGNAMVRCTIQWIIRLDQPLQHLGQRCAVGEQKGGMIKPGMAGAGWGAAFAFPGVQPDMVVIAPRRQKSRLPAVTLGEGKPKDAGVKADGTLKVRDLQMDVADAGVGMDGRHNGLLGPMVCSWLNITTALEFSTGCKCTSLARAGKKRPPDRGTGPGARQNDGPNRAAPAAVGGRRRNGCRLVPSCQRKATIP